ncbi:MAG: hypothetical protein VYA69_14025 [Gemmatimonadota bacterium]|nr:hypothetical protein [Gemmatimonadota bacterium]
MCDVCSELNVNAYLADNWAQQYESKERTSPGFLQNPIADGEMDDVLTAVHYGNEGHGFFAGAGVKTYQDLVDRLWELSKPSVVH